MTLEYKHIQGSQFERPKEIDTESSRTLVYLRKNIEKVTKEDKQSGETIELWEYDEATLSHDDYLIYLNEDASAKLDYLVMMSDL